MNHAPQRVAPPRSASPRPAPRRIAPLRPETQRDATQRFLAAWIKGETVSTIYDSMKTTVANLEREVRIARAQAAVFGELVEHLQSAQERLYELLRREISISEELRKDVADLKSAAMMRETDAVFDGKEADLESSRMA